jgi:hypothetical protein
METRERRVIRATKVTPGIKDPKERRVSKERLDRPDPQANLDRKGSLAP